MTRTKPTSRTDEASRMPPGATLPSPAVHEARARREDIRESMIDLEGALTGPVGTDPAAWWSRTLGALTALREVFRTHVALTEAPDGLLDEIVAYAPRLAHARDRLVRDHVEITASLDRLCFPALPPGGVDAARDAALELLGQLSRHRHRGADFVYEAYDFDIGGGD